MKAKTTSKETTVSAGPLTEIQETQPAFKTWWIIVFLVFALVILKTFIYIKDDKRHGK
tara:strand:+ start:573 stop:746 length:174 start_codon:yes stop_codon:yes gene_type:complete